MRLILLDAKCHSASRPWVIVVAVLYPLVLPDLAYIFAERWLYERKLRAAGVAVPTR